MASVGTGQPLAQPVATMPLVDKDGMVTQFWWRFFFGLFTRNASTVPYTVSTVLTAAGTTQADALGLLSEWNVVTSTPVNSGVRLNAFGVGLNSLIWNFGGNALKIYPPVGSQIDGLGTNNPYSLADGSSREFFQVTSVSYLSR